MNDNCIFFVNEECKKIKALRKGELDDANTHQIRKHFKSLVVVNSTLLEMNLNRPHSISFEKLKRTEKLIGGWHDKIILIDSLHHLLKSNKALKKLETKEIKSTIDIIRHQNEELLKKLNPIIDRTSSLFYQA